jgi:hypothetical protein
MFGRRAITRRTLTLSDIEAVLEIAASVLSPDAVFRAVEGAGAGGVGFRLFTVMRLHPATQEVERLYSSLPNAYPVSGRKPKQGTPWGRRCSIAARFSSPTCRMRFVQPSPMTR